MSSKYKVVEVVDSHLQKEFLNFPQEVIYKNDPNYIRPLDNKIDAVFDKSKNRLLVQGSSIIRFLLKDSFGNTAGRIAAFVNKKNAYLNSQPTGGVGFFECINDKQVASN
ncbi:MAG: hypothetical protein LBH34_04220, partial [Prevotellaceae bacterium]|nr:hypothetical protein [Prevotellaceae bacterium]